MQLIIFFHLGLHINSSAEENLTLLLTRKTFHFDCSLNKPVDIFENPWPTKHGFTKGGMCHFFASYRTHVDRSVFSGSDQLGFSAR